MKLKIENSEYEIFNVTESIRNQTDFKEFVVSVHVKNDLISIDELDANILFQLMENHIEQKIF